MNFILDISIGVVVICVSAILGIALGKFLRYLSLIFGGREEKKKKMSEKEIELWVKRLILFVFFDSVAIIALAYHVSGGAGT